MDKSIRALQFHPLALALSSALALTISTPAFAADIAAAHSENAIEGRITDSRHKVNFQGAQISIQELGLSTVSDRYGAFRFADLPDGEYTLVINYLGAEEVRRTVRVSRGKISRQDYVIGKQKVMDNVIVYGQRAGQAGAINRQKNANNMIAIVSSDAIGQLPDQNAAEALQHLPGISIQRDQGEGRFVGIRGIDPNLNNVTINGLNVPSPEAGVRSVAMDVIPSEVIASLEVSKTVTPDMDASAVGGSIEVKSLSAFDRRGQNYSFTAQSSYNEQVSETSPKLSGSFSDIYQLGSGAELGVATAVSWFKREFGSENIETDGGWGEIEVEDMTTGEDVQVFGAEEIEQRLYRIERERLGAALNFDLHTSLDDKYYLRTLYSEFSDDEYRQRKQYKFDKGAIDLAGRTASSASFTGAEMERDTKDRYEVQEILSVVAGGEHLFNAWQLEYQLGYSKSSEKEPDRIDVAFAGEDLTLGYETSGEKPRLTQSAPADDLSRFALDEVVVEDSDSRDEEISFSFDLSKDFVWRNHNATMKFGGKYRSREKSSKVRVQVYDGGFDDINAAAFGTGRLDYGLGDFGPGLSRGGVHDFVKNQQGFELNALESDIESRGNSYTSEEDIFAAYAMVTLDMDNWQLVAGLRYEGTRFDTRGNRVELIEDDISGEKSVDISPWQVDKDYNHWLPGINVRYNITDDLISRFAYTQTLARPGFSDSAAYQLIETEVSEDDGVVSTERKAEVGNPNLKPYESQNLDFSLEYYPGHIGVLSAGLFYKDIDNFIVSKEVQDNGQWQGFEEVSQPVNGGSASLTGLELAWHKTFDSGFLLGVNTTLVDADDELPNQADTLGNLILGYENNKLSLRLSTSYKGKNFQFEDRDTKVYQDAHTQLDFSGKYYYSDTVQFYLNAVNLTDEAYYLYHGSKQYNYQYEQYGPSFELGFTISSL
ncbi:TonB-dependent receptor [Thalassomonas viridans]|uniref:TonB-dependent receptor n=1 Tax=Thalassomonas viridans TaxID=137584 RepID=A0AAE9Z7Q9_9GAMM|nr:TonB-dependent receptor [Thalassomonas viridans]WDE07595.1 TonB-dependent receptor [Thalassomonas viridans]